MIFESLDVVVVPFPFTDRPATKRRPDMIQDLLNTSAISL